MWSTHFRAKITLGPEGGGAHYTNETWIFDYLSFWYIKQFSNSSEIMCPVKKFINQNNQKNVNG